MLDTAEAIEEMKNRNPEYEKKSPPMSDLQRDWVKLAWGIVPPHLNIPKVQLSDINTVYEGATFIRSQLKKFFELKRVEQLSK